MADWKKLIASIDELSLKVVLADSSTAGELEGLFCAIPALISQPDIAAVPMLVQMLRDTASTTTSLKASQPSKAVEVLSLLCGCLKTALECLDRGQDPHEPVRSFEKRLKDILPVEPDNFSPKPPVLDPSNGPDFYMDFITEMSEHLTTAERSVLLLETQPSDTDAINNIFRAFHTIKGSAGFMDLQDIETFAHQAETMLDMVRQGGLSFVGHVVELTLSSIDVLRKLLALLQEQVGNNGQIKGKYFDIAPQIAALKQVIAPKKNEPIGEILVRQGAITEEELIRALKIQKATVSNTRIGDILVETKAASAKQVDEALGFQKSGVSVGTSIRIQLEKLDNLIDMVGELVISETLVVHSPEISAVTEQQFTRNLAEFDRIMRNLQETVMAIRLVPIGPVFQKMERFVHDLSRKLGKEATVLINGPDTEVDKNIAELVSDPLMHMLRNSLDHGIEPKDVRQKRGKPLVGTIGLSASQKDGYVVIEVKDDGDGLNKDKILKKAIQQGIVKEGEILTENRIFNLIFEAGFSTAENVTETSGRGVGMDVVKKNIDKLHGKINVSSVEGQGTVFCFYLPITMAIVDGIVVRCGNERYVLPIHSVVEFVQPKEINRSRVYDKEQIYKVYDKVYPLVHLNEVFGVVTKDERFESKTICILDSDSGRACVVVDELLGQQQVVIKNLGNKLKNIKGISGAAILGDGRVGLILNADTLIAFATKKG